LEQIPLKSHPPNNQISLPTSVVECALIPLNGRPPKGVRDQYIVVGAGGSSGTVAKVEVYSLRRRVEAEAGAGAGAGAGAEADRTVEIGVDAGDKLFDPAVRDPLFVSSDVLSTGRDWKRERG
jgi:hypothetical protein